MKRGVIVLTTAISVASLSFAQKPVTPKPGTAERKAIVDALRIPIQKSIKQKVIFEVMQLRVVKGWAFIGAIPRQPNGKPINYKGTEYQEAINAGAFDDSVFAIMQKQKGKWKVLDWSLGATDVAWLGFPSYKKAPKAIFGPH